MTQGIDLSRLSPPTIDGLLLDADEIAAEMLATVNADGATVTATAADPAYRIILACAQREMNLRRQQYDALLALSLAYAAGDELDLIGVTYYGVARLDGEADAAYRLRIAATPERFAIGLSGDWYEQNALAVTGVYAAQLNSPTPGVVDVYIQGNPALVDDAGDALYPSGAASAALLAAVTTKVTAADVRQQTDDVTVRAAAAVEYSLAVSLTTYAEPDSAIVLAAARDALAVTLDERNRIGEKINKTIVAGAVFVAGVREATITITRGSDSQVVDEIAGAVGQYPWATASSVTVASS